MRAMFVVLLAATVVTPATARAQTYPVDRGSWRVGGTAGWSSRAYDGASSRDVLAFLSPSAQRFVVPGLALGADLNLSRYRLGGGTRITTYGAGPSATYYLGRGQRALYPYVGGSVVFTRLEASGSVSGPQGTSSNYMPYAGFLSMLARNVGIDTRVYYQRTLSGDDLVGNSSAYGLAIGISAFVF